MNINSSKSTINLLFTGDFVPPYSSEVIFSERLQEILKEKDFSIVNLEAPLTSGKNNIHKTGKNFKASPEGVRHLKNGFFDAVALSNNHIRDFNSEGVNETLDICKQYNILTVGAGANIKEASRPLRICIKGKRISFLNFSEKEFNSASIDCAGANTFELIDVLSILRVEKAENDFVILIYHGGLEYHHLPTPEIVKLFKFLVESGADCIISHHTHRYSGLIHHQGKPILFGLGNFISPTKNKNLHDWVLGLIARIYIDKEGISTDVIPTKMNKDFTSVDLLHKEESASIIAHISELSEIINDETRLRGYWQEVYSRNCRNILFYLNSDTFTGYKLRKRFPFFFYSGLTKYRHLQLLNLINCYSQRNRLSAILENLYKKID